MVRRSLLRQVGENTGWIRPADPHSTYLDSTQDGTYSVNTHSPPYFSHPSPKSTSWPQSPCLSLASPDQPRHVNCFSQEVLSARVRSAFSLISLKALFYLSVSAQAMHSERRPSGPTDRSKPHTFQPLASFFSSLLLWISPISEFLLPLGSGLSIQVQTLMVGL